MFQSVFQYRRPRRTSKLNLVALMDIFTILVFFLLLNSGEAEKLESARFVDLPDSNATARPHGDLVVLIDRDSIWLADQAVASVEDVIQDPESAIENLGIALADYRERKGDLNSYEQENGLALTIMGDHSVPYGLLKSVMVTCRLENFRDIALAVNQIVTPSPSGEELASGKASPPVATRANGLTMQVDY
ncbi:MAG: biopolymer transporter ExbD [Cellvibrionaceae bacterium]